MFSNLFSFLFPRKPPCTEARVKEIVEELLRSQGIPRKVDSVSYRPQHQWFIVRFYSPPSCIIPLAPIKQYCASGGIEGKQEIIEILISKRKGFDEA